MKMKTNLNKCIWTACIAAVAVCMTLSTAHAGNNLGNAYISSVVGVNGECAVDTTDGNTHKWDVQAGGTYIVTLTNATDVDSGLDSIIGVVVHNSCGTNIYVAANQFNSQPGVYTFQVTIPSGTGCGCTMPVEYFTRTADGLPANQPGSGFFAQGYDGTGGDSFEGHLRVSTFDGSCNLILPLCGGPSPTPTPPPPCLGSITACKYYDFNGSGGKDSGEQLLSWPLCLTSDTDPNFTPVTQRSSDGSCTIFSNLPLGTYRVTEGSAGGSWTGTTNSQTITVSQCGQNVEVDFGNYCTIPSGGLTLGFWSNKNGQTVLQAHDPAWRTLLNGLNLRTANGGLYQVPSGSFSTAYSNFRTWLLGATATNMAYMLSAQLSALELNIAYKGVLGSSYDLCSDMTINQLMTNSSASLLTYPLTTSSSNPTARAAQEGWKNCIDAINNGGPVIPAQPCDHSGASVTCPP